MEFPLFFLFPLLVILPAIFHLFIRKNKNLPPGPRGLPILGNLHQIGSLPHCTLSEFSEKHGDIMLLYFGSVPNVVISSSEAANELLKTHDLKTCSRPLLTGTGKFSYNYRDFGFAPYCDYWRELRKICVLELFSAKRVESFRCERESAVDVMINSISEYAASGVAVNLSERTLSLPADVICRVAFGKSFQERGFSQEKFMEMMHEGFAVVATNYSADYFPYVGWIVDRIFGMNLRLEKSFREFDAFYDKIMEDHEIKGKESRREDFIDVLLELEKSQKESADGIEFSKDNIKAILMNVFMAGVDTGGVTMVWVMAELVKNPQIMKKAQQEIRSYIGTKLKVTETDINNFTFLKMVIKETLRLHPPATLVFPREVMSKFNIKGYDIHPKTTIHINAWAIGRDPKVWENPEEFCPNRFRDNPHLDFGGQNNYEMIPFGGGRRGCPGAPMGIKLIELALANLLLHFDWKLPNGMKVEDFNMEEAFGVTAYKKEPLLLFPITYELL